jgi:hypothetical protein
MATFQTSPINVVGPSYQSRTRPLSSQSTVNFYQEFDESGKTPTVLHSWPGQKLIGNAGGKDRGQHVMKRVRYRVSGSNLYRTEANGTQTDLGVIAGTQRCIFANDGENMFIVNAGNVQQYSNLTNSLSTVTDPDIVGSIAVDFLNNQFIYTKPNLFIISDVGDGSTASGLNAAQAESQPDDLIRAYVFDGIANMMGETTNEPWYNSRSGSPPFERIDTQITSVGLAGIHAIDSNDNFMYWLGDDRQVYRGTRSSAQRISNPAISHAIDNYTTVSDAIGWTMTLEGQNFFVLTFPSANKTWAINEGLGTDGWFELSNDFDTGLYNATSHSYLNGSHYVADRLNGNLYELDLDTFTNNGDAINRIRTMSSIHGGLVDKPGKEVQMSRFELILETGVGLISGQGVDPKIMIEASYDGGKSFDGGTWMDIGRLGETNIRAEWFSLNSFYDLVIRISTSDPVHYTIMTGAIDWRLTGR